MAEEQWFKHSKQELTTDKYTALQTLCTWHNYWSWYCSGV